jgi:amidase
MAIAQWEDKRLILMDENIDTGGSSSGSGVAVAANAAAAVGTETSGSILSPSWQNSIID